MRVPIPQAGDQVFPLGSDHLCVFRELDLAHGSHGLNTGAGNHHPLVRHELAVLDVDHGYAIEYQALRGRRRLRCRGRGGQRQPDRATRQHRGPALGRETWRHGVPMMQLRVHVLSSA